MQKSEIHLFILWQRARYNEEKILQDMAKNFTILKKYAITWTPELVSSNFTRFYGVNLPPKSHKEKECGTGEFLLCIVRDNNPIYAERMTSRGPEIVNINMFDAKQRYRDWTMGGHKVHASNSEKETNHDLTLLIGTNISDFIAEHPYSDDKMTYLHRDIEGANGWKSLSHLFYVLNGTIDYVVLRNYENIPENYDFSIHGDIDILTENKDNIVHITNAVAVFPEPYRVYHHVIINSNKIPFDFRYVGDNYYDQQWEITILKQRKLSAKGFYIPDAINQYYSLLYHAYIQKYAIAEDYPFKLNGFAEIINVKFSSDADVLLAQLDDFMQLNKYEYVKCDDITVGYNKDNLKRSKYFNRFGQCIKNVKFTINDVITGNPICWYSKVFRKSHSYVKIGSPWIIDNEKRFLVRVGDGIKFPRLIDEGGGGDEHWIEISEMNGETLFYNKWRTNVNDIRKYAGELLNLIEILYNNDIMHRDIRNDNIFVDDKNHISILDFGFAIDFRNDTDFPCPYNLGMQFAPKHMYSDFYNLAELFECRWSRMPFVARFATELKKIDWEHYKDTEFVNKQIFATRSALKKHYNIVDYIEFFIGKYNLRKYIHNPGDFIRRFLMGNSGFKANVKKLLRKITRKLKMSIL